jgi:hypothetical protein
MSIRPRLPYDLMLGALAMDIPEENVRFYEARYEVLNRWLLRPGDKVVLGDKKNRKCRFCGKQAPEVTFRKVAHAIPEALGNKSIETTYECDTCNEGFGSSIENDLGNWSKPMRTFARIRGKSGVPTLKRGGDTGWRIEYDATGFKISAYEDDPIFVLDEANRRIKFELKRDPHTPVAVLKAFMKIGLTLLPDDEFQNFQEVTAWVRSRDHSIPFLDRSPVIYTFQPGPMPNDLISVFMLRRKQGITDVPYMFLVLGYGNEVFQVMLPSRQHDGEHVNTSLLPFPAPSADPARYGANRCSVLDLSGRSEIKGATFQLELGFDEARQLGPQVSQSDT